MSILEFHVDVTPVAWVHQHILEAVEWSASTPSILVMEWLGIDPSTITTLGSIPILFMCSISHAE